MFSDQLHPNFLKVKKFLASLFKSDIQQRPGRLFSNPLYFPTWKPTPVFVLLHRPLLLTRTCCWWAPHRLEVSSWHLHLLWHGILHGPVWISSPLQFPMSTDTVCFTMVFTTGLWGNLLWCLDHLPPPPSSPLLVSMRLLLTYCFLYSSPSSAVWHFMLYIKYCLGPAITLSSCAGVWSCFSTRLPKLLLRKASSAVPHCQDLSNCIQ